MPILIVYLFGSATTAIIVGGAACTLVGLALVVVGFKQVTEEEPDTLFRGEIPGPPQQPPSAPPPQPYNPYIVLPTPSAQEKLAELELKQWEMDTEIRAFAKALCQWVDLALRIRIP
jgi:hypothetical protein